MGHGTSPSPVRRRAAMAAAHRGRPSLVRGRGLGGLGRDHRATADDGRHPPLVARSPGSKLPQRLSPATSLART